MVRIVPEDAKRMSAAQVLLSADELAKLDDWRFAQRIGSRSEAIRRLLDLGLAAHAAGWSPEAAPEPKKRRKPAS